MCDEISIIVKIIANETRMSKILSILFGGDIDDRVFVVLSCFLCVHSIRILSSRVSLKFNLGLWFIKSWIYFVRMKSFV